MRTRAEAGRRDELAQLPPALADAVRACVHASGVAGNEKTSLTRELSAHLLDAIDAGKSEQEILRAFGDAAFTGALIRHVRLPVLRLATRVAMAAASLGAAAMLALYAGSAVTLHAHSPAAISTSADADRIRRLEKSPVDLDEAARVVEALLEQMYSDDGRLTADGLRIVQRLKGVERVTRAAVVAEPAYFVLSASREDVDREWRRIARVISDARASGPGSAEWHVLEAEAEQFSWAHRVGFRYAPLAIVLPRIMVALRREAAAR